MTLQIIGEHPLAKDRSGKLLSRIATLFPPRAVLITLPGIHASQRWHYLDWLNARLAREGQPPLTRQEESAAWNSAVDLIVEDGSILIRPDPDNMPLAFQADDLLQELFPKHKIRFLHVLNKKVRDAIKRRGECWRITPLPTSAEEMREMIDAARIGVAGREIYYYNRTTGTRLLTAAEFRRLGAMDDEELRRHLEEIREFSASLNPQGHPEIDFFTVEDGFSQADFAPHEFLALDAPALREVYQSLCGKFLQAVAPGFREDDSADPEWRNRMFASLIGTAEDLVAEETLLGLSPEFFMQIRWLVGGRIEEGELIFDPVYDPPRRDHDPELARLCDEKARGFIYNFVREYGDLEYVNIGRVENSLSRRAPSPGRRAVYIAEMKLRANEQELVRVIRMQKWGIREHLDRGKFHLPAITESKDYTEYTLDRRLGCQQLGMNLPCHVVARDIYENYTADWTGPQGIPIWAAYFERDYIRGIATDKMPRHRFQDRTFARKFARLLGQAAAPNIIVGRSDDQKKMFFDDGDEVVVEDAQHMPSIIIVADQTGTFANYNGPLQASVAAYAGPINRRVEYLTDPDEFVRAYLEGFHQRFRAIQEEYRHRSSAFDGLFRHRRWDPGGSFAYRWECVLRRLAEADACELVELILAASAVKPRGFQLRPCTAP